MARLDQFQLNEDAFVQWPRFVNGYGDKKDAQSHNFQKIWRESNTHQPNQTEQL